MAGASFDTQLKLVQTYQNYSVNGGTVALSVSDAFVRFTGTYALGDVTATLPNMFNSKPGYRYEYFNESTNNVNINDAGANRVASVVPGDVVILELDTASANGTWRVVTQAQKTIYKNNNLVQNPFVNIGASGASVGLGITTTAGGVISAAAADLIEGNHAFKVTGQGGTQHISRFTCNPISDRDLGLQMIAYISTKSGTALDGDFEVGIYNIDTTTYMEETFVSIPSGAIRDLPIPFIASTTNKNYAIAVRQVGNHTRTMSYGALHMSRQTFVNSPISSGTLVMDDADTSFSGATVASKRITWQRDKDRTRIVGNVRFSAVSGPIILTVASKYQLSLNGAVGRNGGTADAKAGGCSALPNSATLESFVGTARFVGSSTTQIQFYGDDGEAAWNTTNPFTWSANAELEFTLDYPVSGWEVANSSMAASSEKQFFYNTSTTDADDTTSFGTGPNGGLVPNLPGSGFTRAKTAQATYNIQRPDDIDLYIVLAGTNIPVPASLVYPPYSIGGSEYGVRMEPVSGSFKQFRVYFGGAGANPSATWASRFTAGDRYFIADSRGINSGVISLATATNPGLVGISGQQFAGDKDLIGRTRLRKLAYTTITGVQSLTANDGGHYLCNPSAAFTQGLPTAVGNDGLYFKFTNVAPFLVTLDGNASETIGGNLTKVLGQYDSADILAFNGNWIIV